MKDRAASRTDPYKLALKALANALMATRAGLSLSASGAVARHEENLVPGVGLRDFEEDLRQGDGDELKAKFFAAHSSSALAVNVFAPFKRAQNQLELVGCDGFTSLHFERKCNIGLGRGKPASLDLVAESPGAIVAVESKCTEYLRCKDAAFSDAYEVRIRDARRESAWFIHMMELRSAPTRYSCLDAAQLIKHAFGLAYTYPGKDITLLYVYWEPSNAGQFEAFGRHRKEAAEFARRVEGSNPKFLHKSYNELWSQWLTPSVPKWLPAHIENLRSRYEIPI